METATYRNHRRSMALKADVEDCRGTATIKVKVSTAAPDLNRLAWWGSRSHSPKAEWRSMWHERRPVISAEEAFWRSCSSETDMGAYGNRGGLRRYSAGDNTNIKAMTSSATDGTNLPFSLIVRKKARPWK
jgi:hypothetical protein